MTDKPEDVIKQLETLVQTPGFIHVLAEMIIHDMFIPRDQFLEVDWPSRLTFQEATFITGLMLKKPLNTSLLTQEEIEAKIQEARKILEDLHGAYIKQMPLRPEIDAKNTTELEDVEAGSDLASQHNEHFRKLVAGGNFFTEAIFYADSGSYDFQYTELAPKLYGLDSDWLRRNNIDLHKASILYAVIKKITEASNYVYAHPKKSPEGERPMTALDVFCFNKSFLLSATNKLYPAEDITADDIKNFLNRFSSKVEDQNKDLSAPGQLNIAAIQPIIEIQEDVYFVPVDFNLAKAIYESPIYWMRKDESYLNIATANRGRSIENITFDYFKDIFGELAFKSVKIVKGGKDLTDIDVMGVIGNTAVIVQNKSQRMTLEAQQGLEEYLRKDFTKAVQKAYDQGIASRDAILNQTDYKFVDEDRKEIKLPQGIEHVYILCVVADVYPAIIHQSQAYLNRPEGAPWPLPISLLDLDLIKFYLPDPYDFTLYVKQRIEMTDIARAAGEMALLAYHMRKGLFKIQGADIYTIDQTYAQYIDADYMYKKGRAAKPKNEDAARPYWKNLTFDRLVGELKANIKDPKLTDIILFLISLPPELVNSIMNVIEQVRAKSKVDGKRHDASIPISMAGEPWGGITYVVAPTFDELQKQMEFLARINKYRSKTQFWLGMGAVSGSPKLIDGVIFGDSPWERSDEMDEFLEEHTRRTSAQTLVLKPMSAARTQEKRLPKKKRTQKKANKRERQARKRGRRHNRKA